MKKEKFLHPSLTSKKTGGKKIIQTWSRSSYIPSSLLSKTLQVYNGRNFVKFTVTEDMLGYKLGEFARTRKRGADPRPKFSSRRKSPVRKRLSPATKGREQKRL